MRRLGRVAFMVSLLLLLLLILAFVLENQQNVSLLFLGWSMPELPVSLLVVAALLVGMLVGPCVGWLCRRLLRRPLRHPA
ncbi:lipopolysaccharide assembly protein LapA domain-containing protein [Pseudomonas serbica]|uniref:lipopolysaccharide assembly protein LapA domain-containing protein n=1 Tax=Pseudomonas serbica TaxID=2965074 RepID=UPI0039E338F2